MSEIQGISPPDTSPDSALPLPPSLPHPKAASLSSLRAWLPLYMQKTDRTISHLNRILSTPAGTDRLLMSLGYSSLLASTILKRISLTRLQQTTRLLIEKAISLPPDTTLVITHNPLPSTTLLISTRLRKLSDLISDFRIFARLWGLLGIWAWGKSVYENPSDDALLRRVAYAQVLVNILYQYLENAAYLSSKGVLSWSTQKQNRAWLWSSRFWMAHVGLDLLRLGHELALQRRSREEGEKDEGKMEQEKQWRSKWRRELLVNLAYAPLTLHWSLEEGLVGDFWVGLLGSVAGLTGLRELWTKTGIS